MVKQNEDKNVGSIFLSWSGEQSRQVAEALREWLGDILPSITPWISTRDLEKGTMFQSVISDQLSVCSAGIFCLTPENRQGHPWMLFEAGALYKGLGTNRILTYLFGIEYKDVEPPLSAFNHTKAEREDTFRLGETINEVAPEKLTERHLRIIFDSLWPNLEKRLAQIAGSKPSDSKARSLESMVIEVLELLREERNERTLRKSFPELTFHDDKNVHPFAKDLGPQAKPNKIFLGGKTIVHPKYGTGTILRREGSGDNAKLTISFPGVGLKKIVEKYAGIVQPESSSEAI